MHKTLTHNNQEITYRLNKSRRARRITLSVRANSEIVLTQPFRLADSFAEKFIKEKLSWVLEKLEHFKKAGKLDLGLVGGSVIDYKKNKETARQLITEKLSEFNSFYNFTYKRVAIKNQKHCWGSCSARQNLNFNYRLALLPEELCDYVVVHELCHLRHLNHGKSFWQEVENTIPDYQQKRRDLRKYIIK